MQPEKNKNTIRQRDTQYRNIKKLNLYSTGEPCTKSIFEKKHI